MKITSIYKFSAGLALVLILVSCGKEFLEPKRDAAQVIPKSISDYQAILDNSYVLSKAPSVELGIIGGDEFYLRDGRLTTLTSPYQRNGYIWAKNVYENTEVPDWNNAYQRILYANLALEVEKVIPNNSDQPTWNNVVGSALFYRAYSYFQLAQLFCKPYDVETASTDLGVPIRLDYDPSLKSTRSNVKAVYEQVINDLKRSVDLLPVNPTVKQRPSKPAALLVLAKCYLQMGDYKQAGYYADQGLQLKNILVDFKGLNFNTAYTFTSDYGSSNPEVLFYWDTSGSIIAAGRFNADSTLLKSYEPNDLRTKAYFQTNTDGRILFKGSYQGGNLYFVGLATDELFLIRAECSAREGLKEAALNDINQLLKHRYSNAFQPITADNSEQVLFRVLLERRKELFMRGVRWDDLRRLNKDHRFATTLVRQIDGQGYLLPPNDPRYIWPIPDNEVDLSGLEQNPR